MENWYSFVLKVIPLLGKDYYWTSLLMGALDDCSRSGIHIAIFNEPYLSYLLGGEKTVESRFGVRKCAPYGKVASGDIVFLKKSSGPIVGICTVSDVWFYALNKKSLNKIRTEFTVSLCAQDPDFWLKRETAMFATLMQIGKVKSINPVEFPKKDRRGWVVLRSTMNSFTGMYL